MRDQLYPVKVDNVNRTAVLDGEGNVLPGAVEALGAENNLTIAKISWLSKRETGKAYGSMVVYVTKGSDERRLLDGQYFDLAGELACTNVFERRNGPVQCFNCQGMGRKAFSCKKPQTCGSALRIFQLNVRKRDTLQLSVLNDADLKDFVVLGIAEPYARKRDGMIVTAPMGHSNWSRILPTQTNEAGWPVRSMLWVRKDIDLEQVPIPSADLTAAILHLQDRDILVASIYVQGKDEEALILAMRELDSLITRFRNGVGKRTDVVLAGDFNRQDLRWGGDSVTSRRQGEAQPIIDLMNEHGLCSLSPRGTKTWQGADKESTIDLVLTSTELAGDVVKCAVHPTEYGSDHRAIQTVFGINMPERRHTEAPAPERTLDSNPG
ncbi:hypothetical protein CDD83_550 [Cordyceps sp. RAO-2017]|nr:hypothetical protein CDD83_550 [Cordyceps sp. RAO-2017]